MAGKNWVIGLFAFLMAALLFVGYMALAAESGSKDDPLVTASYITEELMPSLNRKIDEAILSKTDHISSDLNQQYDLIMSELDASIEEFNKSFSKDSLNSPEFIESVANAVINKLGGATGTAGNGLDSMQKVDVTSGKTILLYVGSEALLRLGTANCVAPNSPGLIDTTGGGELVGGGALQKNHMYLCTVEGRGFVATSDATVFIRGKYTLS